MNKSPGQIAYEIYWNLSKPVAEWDLFLAKKDWERAAAAVLRDYDTNYDAKIAFKAGKKIECKPKGYEIGWYSTCQPTWAVNCEYRVAPEPQPKFKVGDKVLETLFNSRGTITKADYSLDHSAWLYSIAKPSDNYANNIPESYISLIPWTLPAPPAGRVKIELPQSLELKHGNFSFASV